MQKNLIQWNSEQKKNYFLDSFHVRLHPSPSFQFDASQVNNLMTFLQLMTMAFFKNFEPTAFRQKRKEKRKKELSHSRKFNLDRFF